MNPLRAALPDLGCLDLRHLPGSSPAPWRTASAPFRGQPASTGSPRRCRSRSCLDRWASIRRTSRRLPFTRGTLAKQISMHVLPFNLGAVKRPTPYRRSPERFAWDTLGHGGRSHAHFTDLNLGQRRRPL
jgi:hypothetical protein